MKSFLRTAILTCAAVCLSLGFSVSPAEAKITTKQVRIAQERLMGLGYFVGKEDGVMGSLTIDAVEDFQYRSGLPITGTLNKTTYSVLKQTYYSAHWNGYNYAYNYGYNGHYTPIRYTRDNLVYSRHYEPVNYITESSSTLNTKEQAENVRNVPIRYASLAINEDNHGAVSNYSVMLNGNPVLNAYNQPAPVRVSENYNANGEDTVVFTVSDAYSACSYKNYLLTVRSDGSYVPAHEVGNCVSELEPRYRE